MASVDNVFRDTSGRAYNEFTPVGLVLRPYMHELQSAAEAYVKNEFPAEVAGLGNGEDCLACSSKRLAHISSHLLITVCRH